MTICNSQLSSQWCVYAGSSSEWFECFEHQDAPHEPFEQEKWKDTPRVWEFRAAKVSFGNTVLRERGKCSS